MEDDPTSLLVVVQKAFDTLPNTLNETFENVFTELRIISLPIKQGEEQPEGAFFFVRAAGSLQMVNKPGQEDFLIENGGDICVKNALIHQEVSRWTKQVIYD